MEASTAVPAKSAQALRSLFRPLARNMQPAFDAAADAGLARLLPVLGPVFGVFIIAFGAWDAWVDPARAGLTLRIRVALVLAGALAYGAGRLRWRPGWRCAWLYATHAGAMVLCAALLPHGLVLALPGLTGALFLLALVEPRPRRFLLAGLAPALLLALLAVRRLPPREAANTLLLYGLTWALALGVALAGLHQRRRAFVAEQALLDAVRYDSLSGALTRAYATELATHDLALAQRHRRPLALAMFDIDHFKHVNDRFGHAAGDRALCAMVAACKEQLRAGDYIGRFGGEEFVCVMPDTGAAEALACAERIRAAIAALCLPAEAGPLRFTASAGVAVLGAEYADWTSLLRAADGALYRAKRGGRNRCLLALPAAGGGAPP